MRRFLTKTALSIAAIFALYGEAQAQGVGINDDNTAPDNSAMLDVKSTSKGVLIPRVPLTSTAVAAPVAAPATSLLVYNTQTAGDVTPGFYYWNGTQWVRLASAASTGDAWLLTGNAGTDPTINFVGTTDNQPLLFRVNGMQAGFLQDLPMGANTYFGVQTGESNATGTGNTAVGNQTLRAAPDGINNVAIGGWAMLNATDVRRNVVVGHSSGQGLTSSGDNTIIGYNAGNNPILASHNTLIGSNTDASEALSFATAIGAGAIVDQSNSVILGRTTDMVGVGTTAPAERLHVVGNIRNSALAGVGVRLVSSDANGNLTNFANGANGQVLTVVGGVPTWSAAAGSGWGLTGNAGTVDGTNFLGTTDNVPFNLRVNNIRAGRIENTATTGNTALGYDVGTTGNWTTAIGARALANNDAASFGNVAVGRAAMELNTTGSQNVAVGTAALGVNTTGFGNVAVGQQALVSNVSTNANTAIGYYALFTNTASNNTAGGESSLRFNTTGTENSAWGLRTLFSNTTGSRNSGLGSGAIFNVTSGNNNSGLGYQAGAGLTTGSNNTFLGSGTTGSANLQNATAVGANVALAQDNTVVLGNSANVGIGINTPAERLHVVGNIRNSVLSGTGTRLVSSDANGNLTNFANGTDGQVLTIVAGVPAWSAAASGSGWALTGNAGTDATINFVGTSDNQPLVFRTNNVHSGLIGTPAFGRSVYLGYNAGLNTTSGNANAVIGFNSFVNNTTGNGNAVLGTQALFANVSGNQNVAIGSSALSQNNADNNIAIGFSAMAGNTDGTENIAIGTDALRNLSSNSINLAMGRNALQNATNAYANIALGAEALQNLSTGAHNLAIGHGAGMTVSGEHDLVILGAHADAVAGIDNATAIGSNAVVNGSNTMRLGNAMLMQVETQFNYTIVSDKRFKYNVQDDVPGLDFITRLRPVTYNFDTRKFDEHVHADSKTFDPSKNDYSASMNTRRTGFLAQDVEATARELGYAFDGVSRPQNEKGNYAVDYTKFVMPLVKSVQELNAKVQQLEAENAALKAQAEEIKALRKEMDAMKALLEQK